MQVLMLKDISDNDRSQLPHIVTFGRGTVSDHSPYLQAICNSLSQFCHPLSGGEGRGRFLYSGPGAAI